MNDSEPWLPLKGIKIADFTQVIAGPACSMLLADMGAEVIKIEPLTGDFWRKTVGGSAFANFNRNKRSLAVNLKNPKGHEAVMKIVERADVFLENFTPGTMDKLGLGYEKISGMNPQIIYGSISGFGQEGPYRDRPGYDPVAQAMSGIMINTGEPDGPPVRVLPTMVDYLSGNHMAYAIALALMDRAKTGKGKRIEIALLDVAIMQMGQFVAMYTLSGELPKRMGSGYLAAAPYQAFETQDGYVLIAVTTDEMWKNFCGVLKLDHLFSNPQYAALEGRVKSRPELAAAVSNATRQHKSKDLEALLVAASVPCGRLMNIDEIISDPHVQFRKIIADVEDPRRGTIKIIKTPIFVSGKPPEIKRRAPLIGEQTAEILAELGYSQAEIKNFFEAKVAVEQKPPIGK
jgi:crotonobetainyl-CoA:carnitine CoA-transferase CaiB-like acyl-CoA transferase